MNIDQHTVYMLQHVRGSAKVSNYDASLIKWDKDQFVSFMWTKELELPETVYFEADFEVITQKDFIYADPDWPIISRKMLSVLQATGKFPARAWPVVMLDRSIKPDKRFYKQAEPTPEIVNYDYIALQLLEHLDVFDWENSVYDKDWLSDDKVENIKKLVLKQPSEDLPPIFRVASCPSLLMISHAAKEALETAGCRGISTVPIRQFSDAIPRSIYRSYAALDADDSKFIGNLAKAANMPIDSCKDKLFASKKHDMPSMTCNDGKILEIIVGGASRALGVELCDMIDLHLLKGLKKLYFRGSNEATFDSYEFSGNPSLEELTFSGYKVKQLDISRNPALKYLNCEQLALTELDVSQNPQLEYLNCWGNQLRRLDLTVNTKLKTLYCTQNPFESGGVVFPGQDNSLETIQFELNPTESFNFEKFLKLKTLNLKGGQKVDISKNANLHTLKVSKSNLR